MEAIKKLAARRECTPAQVALSWVSGQGDHIVAIPGTTKLANLETNLGTLDCRLTDKDRSVLNNLAGKVRGDRYSPEKMAAVNR